MTFWKAKPLYFVKGNCLSFLKVYYFVVFQYGLVEAEPSIAHKSGVSMLSLVQNGSKAKRSDAHGGIASWKLFLQMDSLQCWGW